MPFVKSRHFQLLLSLFLVIFAGSSLNNTLNNNLSLKDANTFIGEILGAFSTSETNYHHVVRIIDGDTLVANIDGKNQTIRLVGIDTPETKDPRKPVQCFGKEASTKLSQLTSSGQIRLEYDSKQGESDRFGRTLAYVFTPDNTFVNQEMIKQGFAYAYTKTDSDYLQHFKQLELLARQQERGLWGSCLIIEK